MQELLKKDSSEEDDIMESNDMDDSSNMSSSMEKQSIKPPEKNLSDKLKTSQEFSSKLSVTQPKSEIRADLTKKQSSLDFSINEVQEDQKIKNFTNQSQKTQLKEILSKPSVTQQSSDSENKQIKKQVNFENIETKENEKKNVSLTNKLNVTAKPNKYDEKINDEEEYKLSITQKLLQLEKEIKNTKNQTELRQQKLKQYCELCQEEGKRLAHSQDQAEQRKAVFLQQQCVKLINDCFDEQNPLYDLLYVAQNNLAHFYNQLGDIEKSLEFMLKAHQNLNKLTTKNDAGTSTFLPEICLNICNAYIYLDKLSEARQFADQSIKSSQKCVEHLQKKLKDVQELEKLKIEQLIETQLSLNIQSYQTKAKIFLKLDLFQEAIAEYKQAKDIVERNYGTNHQLFKELANLVSETNVKLKSVNYSNVGPPARSPQSLSRRPQTAIKKQDKGYTSFKTESTKMAQTISSAKGKVNSTKVISEDEFDESEVVQREDGAIDIRSDTSAFKMSKSAKQQRRQKSKRERSESTNRQFSQRQSSASSRTGNLKYQNNYNGYHKSLPMNPIHNHPQRVMMNPFVQLIQPPFNAGIPHLGHNRYNHLQYMTKNNDMWKFNHFYTPNMLGFLGYHSYNSERPKSFYQTNLRMLPFDQRPKNIKKVTVIKDVVSQAAQSLSSNEIKQLTDEIKIQVNHLPKSQVVSDSLNSKFVDDLLRQLTLKQSDERKHLIQALNDQKIIIERQLYEREIAKCDREVLIQRINELKFIKNSPSTNKSQKFAQKEPLALMAPVHPIYGPTIWDENSRKWTFPYLQQFIDAGIELPVGEIQEKIEIIEQYEPLPHTKDISCQKFPDPIKKPKLIIRKTQTDPEFEIPTYNKLNQSEIVNKITTETQYNVSDLPKSARRLYMKRKEREFYQEFGILCVRKRNLIKNLNKLEILSLYFCENSEGRINSIKITIYNYTNKSYVFKGTYNKLKYLSEFDAKIFCTLSRPSLELIEFELSPFKRHLLVIKSIIKLERANQKKIISEIQQTKEKIVLPQKQAKIIYVNRAEKPKQDIQLQIDDGLCWKLINDDGTFFEEKEDDNHIWLAACRIQRFFKKFVAQKKIIEKVQQSVREVIMQIHKNEDYEEFTIQLCFYNYSQTLLKFLNTFSKMYKSKIYLGEPNDFGFKVNKNIIKNDYLDIVNKQIKNIDQINYENDKFEDEEDKNNLQQKENKFMPKFYQLEVFKGEPIWVKPIPFHATVYPELRLPYDYEELEYYLEKATHFKYQDGQVKALKLLRLKRQEAKRVIGCNEIAKFKMVQYEGYVCKIYKRQRIHPISLKMIRDYKIKVQQTNHLLSWDYIAVRKLPCSFDDLEEEINKNLIIRFNKRVTYFTQDLTQEQKKEQRKINMSPILHLILQVRNKFIYSQKYYDLCSMRFDSQFFGQFYISQNPLKEKRTPNEEEIQSKTCNDPLYEIYIQKLVPFEDNLFPYKYEGKEYMKQKLKERKRKRKINKKYAKNNSDSSSESDDKPLEPSAKYYWDISELARMQLDEVTGRQQYLQITVTRVDCKQEKDSFIMPLNYLPQDFDFMPSKDLMFQWIGESLKLKQKSHDQLYKFELSSGIEIFLDDRYKSDKSYVSALKALKQKEIFLSQDISRLQERNFVNTVYRVQPDLIDDEQNQFKKHFYVIESIDIDNPEIRDYQEIYDLKGVRGPLLTKYLDQNFLLKNVKQKLFKIDFKESVLDFLKRQKVKVDQIEELHKINNQSQEIQKEKSVEKEIKVIQQEVIQVVKPVSRKAENLGTFAQFDIVIDKYKLKVSLNKFQTKSNVVVHNICYQINVFKTKDDTFSFKIKNLPVGLQKNEDNVKKLQEVFQKRLKIVWDEEWRIQDAYIDNTIQKEQVIHRIVEVKQWHHYYEKINQVKIIEKQVIVEQIVEKPIFIEKIVEKPMNINQVIEVPKEDVEPIEIVNPIFIRPVESQMQGEKIIEEIQVIQEIKEPVQKIDWDDQQLPTKQLIEQVQGKFKIKGATMIYKIFSDNEKNYYFDCETQALNKKLNLYNGVIFGDNFEQEARDELKKKNNLNPTKKKMAEQLNELFRPEFEKICENQINEKIQPENWIPKVKKLLKNRFTQ